MVTGVEAGHPEKGGRNIDVSISLKFIAPSGMIVRMNAAHKIGLDPTPTQEKLLWEHVGWARFAFNKGMEIAENLLDAGESVNGYALTKIFNEIKREKAPWSTVLSQNAAKNALHNCGNAWKRFLRDLKKEGRKAGRPHFKSKHRSKPAFRADNGPGVVRTEGNRILLPRIGSVRLHEEARLEGEVLQCTISHDGLRWYASLLFELPDAAQKTEGSTVGVDVGLRKMAVTFDGEDTQVFENPKPLKAHLKELASIDRAISRSVKVNGRKFESNRRKAKYRARRKLLALIRNIRHDAIHKATSTITKAARVVCIEDLIVRGWMRNRRLSRSTADVAPGMFLRILEQKCQREGIQVVKASRWFPSSKTCSVCQVVNSDLGFQETWRCPTCSTEHNRDINAATNLYGQGLAEYVEGGTNLASSKASVEASSRAVA